MLVGMPNKDEQMKIAVAGVLNDPELALVESLEDPAPPVLAD